MWFTRRENNGIPTDRAMLPNYGAYTARLPVHTLEKSAHRDALLRDEDSFYRPPTSRSAGVTHGRATGCLTLHE